MPIGKLNHRTTDEVNVLVCCDAFAAETLDGTDCEMYGPGMSEENGRWLIHGLNPISFCPYCGTKLGPIELA